MEKDIAEDAPNTLSLPFLEALYADYLLDPASVSDDFQAYFAQIADEEAAPEGPMQLGPSFRPSSVFNPSSQTSNGHGDNGHSGNVQAGNGHASNGLGANGHTGNGHATGLALSRAAGAGTLEVPEAAVRQDRVDALVRAYRVRGHMMAKIDPLGLPRPSQPELDPEFYELSAEDLERKFSSRTIFGAEALTLREIIQRLSTTYCRSIGVQFMHIDDLAVKSWLQDRMEGSENRIQLSRDEQLRILTKLTDAAIFEEFIHKKFVGAKSFSLEGSESLIPLLAFAIDRAAEHGVDEIVLGMAHRGRLNVLANIMGKSPRDIFREFQDTDPELYFGSGDVKYHLGHSSDFVTATGRRVHLSLCFNPSHLEFVDPVVIGRTRAKQDRVDDLTRSKKIGLMIHGDAAFAGEGVIQETLNLSQLDAYTTGGTIHVIVNNQIGFTTPPSQGRSTTYATDVAKMLQIPVFHVNGEDPEAVAQVVRLAMDFRDTFLRDVVIDMYGYRRHGHNETDEPAFTQPILYRAIQERKSVRDGYLEHLLKLGGLTREEADRIAVERRDHLESELGEARRKDYVRTHDWLGGYWKGYRGGPEVDVPEVTTAIDKARIAELTERQNTLPADFHPHKQIEKLVAQRRAMGQGERPFDWGSAELLAFASLVTDGTRVRLTGQDSGRGTFSQRHAVLHDFHDGHAYVPLCHLGAEQGPIEIYNSALSEVAVLGFEYGYSLDWPEALVMWEAQFGDFANAAQVIIDQFIVSAEDKWKRLSGLVLLLPHGYEGQGPEHSSARIERFLALCAEENIQVVQPSTPAQYFHLLRRQVLRPWRKPLVVFTPKSLLRHPQCVSSLDDFANGRFQRVIPDAQPREAKRVLLASGKVCYDLEKRRAELGRDDVALVRIEQFYPLPDMYLRSAIDQYEDGTPVYWVQEEPENMGAWRNFRARFGPMLFGRFPFAGVCRAESASPATGSANCHKLEQQELLERAFG
ncbi:MAG TPA: 2-oxoglutarate dehydrogenase E1 component [Polyangiaceae bacterium]|nr:2-oxoglutarate dehydrogenase E1 component [Polyangiaceae bacterium]